MLLFDYLVADWVCFFGREFVVDFFQTWRQYLSLFSSTHVLLLDWCLESRVIFVIVLIIFSLLHFITKFFKSCLLWPFSTNISIKQFSSSLIYFSEHIECALWRNTLEYTLNTLLMMLRSMHDVGLICMLVMVLVMLMPKQFKDFFSFSYSMVYWIAGSCLFKISWKVFSWCFDVKWAWLSSTYRLNVYCCICIVRASVITLCCRCCKWLSDNTTISVTPMGPAFSNNLILFS